MKRSALALIMSLAISGVAACAHQQLAMSGLEETYSLGSPVSINISNRGRTTVEITAGLEFYSGGDGWVVWPYGVENGVAMAIAPLHILAPGESIVIPAKIAEVKEPPLPPGAVPFPNRFTTFRYSIYLYDVSNHKLIRQFVSQPFKYENDKNK